MLWKNMMLEMVRGCDILCGNSGVSDQLNDVPSTDVPCTNVVVASVKLLQIGSILCALQAIDNRCARARKSSDNRDGTASGYLPGRRDRPHQETLR